MGAGLVYRDEQEAVILGRLLQAAVLLRPVVVAAPYLTAPPTKLAETLDGTEDGTLAASLAILSGNKLPRELLLSVASFLPRSR